MEEPCKIEWLPVSNRSYCGIHQCDEISCVKRKLEAMAVQYDALKRAVGLISTALVNELPSHRNPIVANAWAQVYQALESGLCGCGHALGEHLNRGPGEGACYGASDKKGTCACRGFQAATPQERKSCEKEERAKLEQHQMLVGLLLAKNKAYHAFYQWYMDAGSWSNVSHDPKDGMRWLLNQAEARLGERLSCAIDQVVGQKGLPAAPVPAPFPCPSCMHAFFSCSLATNRSCTCPCHIRTEGQKP